MTYVGAVRDVLDRNCVGCHYEGGPGGFSLNVYAEAGPRAASLVAAVDAGLMPPWQPDPACHPLQGERVMPDTDQDLLREWALTGATEGVPDGRPPYTPVPHGLQDYSHSGVVPGFVPNLSGLDLHHCFLFDTLTFEEAVFAQAHQVIAGSGAVHHVRAYMLPPQVRAAYQDLDDASPDFGFPCTEADWQIEYGHDASLVAPDPYPPHMDHVGEFLGSEEKVEYSDEVARPIAAQSSIGMEVHYSSIGGAVEPDFTEIRMRITDVPPARVVEERYLTNLDITIPAGEPRVEITEGWPYWDIEPLTLQRSSAHMHLLASGFLAQVEAPGGATSCLLSIPRWDPDHIGAYYFPEDELVVVQSGERIRSTCIYDNSPENQPIIGGVQGEAVDVSRGPSATDEMCIFQVSSTTPYVRPLRPSERACARVQGCGAACTGSAAEVATCKQACAEQDEECAECFQKAALQCLPACDSLKDDPCWRDCNGGSRFLGGSVTMCLEHQCPEVGVSYMTCVEGMAEGTCPLAAGVCGL